MVDYKEFDTQEVNTRSELEDLRDRHKPRVRSRPVKPRGVVINQDKPKRRNDPQSSSSDASSDEEFRVEAFSDIQSILEHGKLQHGVKEQASKNVTYSPSNLGELAKTVESALNVSNDDFRLLSPALLPAFGLKNKAWRWVLTDHLK